MLKFGLKESRTQKILSSAAYSKAETRFLRLIRSFRRKTIRRIFFFCFFDNQEFLEVLRPVLPSPLRSFTVTSVSLAALLVFHGVLKLESDRRRDGYT